MAGSMDSFSVEKCFEEQLEYKETFGNCTVPVELGLPDVVDSGAHLLRRCCFLHTMISTASQ
eukprot:9296506-Ditylum_brightwellii.AAC.1